MSPHLLIFLCCCIVAAFSLVLSLILTSESTTTVGEKGDVGDQGPQGDNGSSGSDVSLASSPVDTGTQNVLKSRFGVQIINQVQNALDILASGILSILQPASTAVTQDDVSDLPGSDIIFFAGQSNAVGSPDDGTIDPLLDSFSDDRFLQFGCCSDSGAPAFIPYYDKIVLAKEPLMHIKANPSGIGFFSTFMKYYLPSNLKPNRTAMVVPCAWGGTGFNRTANQAGGLFWNPGDLMYQLALAQLQKALASGPFPQNNRLVGFVWDQGEADSPVFTSAQYITAFDTMVTALKAAVPQFTSSTWILNGSFTPSWEGTEASVSTFNDFYSVGIKGLNRRYFYSATATNVGTTDTGVHFTPAGYRQLGLNYWKAYQQAMLNTPALASYDVLKLQTSSITSSSVVLTWNSCVQASNYLVSYKLSSASSFTDATTLPSATNPTYTLSGLTTGSSYVARIITINSTGVKSQGAQITFSTL